MSIKKLENFCAKAHFNFSAAKSIVKLICQERSYNKFKAVKIIVFFRIARADDTIRPNSVV